MVVVFPDGGRNGWYTNAFDGSAHYEDDFMGDLLPTLGGTLPVLEGRKHWGLAGLSMGGFGALKLALKYPKQFSFAVSHSGSLEKPAVAEPHPVFGDPHAHLALRRQESLPYLVEQRLCDYPTERPFLMFDCGTEDPLLEPNRRFRDHLVFLGYPHTYEETRGEHTWPYWDRVFRKALPEVAQRLGAEPFSGQALSLYFRRLRQEPL
jgi:S-formylglutathione hydrolase FrmB